MRILLVGASGVIGRPLIGLLKAAGHEVFGTTRRPDKSEMLCALGAEPIVLDAYDRDAVYTAVRDARPDAIINQLTDLSAMDVDATNRLRQVGTRNLVDAANAAGVRRMLTQSIAFVYEPADELATEDEPLNVGAPEPWSGPAVGVAVMEEIANEAPESVILRYGFFYDANTGFNGDGFTARQPQRGALAANDNVHSFIHVADAAEATMLALDWPAGVYNIVDDEPVEARVWAPAVAAANGWPKPPRGGRSGPDHESRRLKREGSAAGLGAALPQLACGSPGLNQAHRNSPAFEHGSEGIVSARRQDPHAQVAVKCKLSS